MAEGKSIEQKIERPKMIRNVIQRNEINQFLDLFQTRTEQETIELLKTEKSSYKTRTEINLGGIVYSYIVFSPIVVRTLNMFFKIVEIDDLINFKWGDMHSKIRIKSKKNSTIDQNTYFES